MKVIFYTATCFLDLSVEVIRVLKEVVDLHVLIEITPESKNYTISEVESLPDNQVFVEPSQILNEKGLQYLAPYFDGVKSVKYVSYNRKSVYSSLQTTMALRKLIKGLKPDVIHVEALLIRSISLIPSLFFCKRLMISIHDPLPHSGEKDWKIELVKKVFSNFPVSKGYFFYSKFALNEFESYYTGVKARKWVLKMAPFTYFNNYLKDHKKEQHILFFGRISEYKGVDVLLRAMPSVLKDYPNEVLTIAGRTINNYQLNQAVLAEFPENIVVHNRHIPNSELVGLISSAKFIICPYIDATQSGVLMTAFALNKPVIASSTGAFPEYLQDNFNGYLFPVGDAEKLAETIKFALSGKNYQLLEDNLSGEDKANQWKTNSDVLLDAYTSR